MANVKIKDLAALTNPASTDVLPIVDVGADVTKKISIADLLENAGSGTEALPGIAFDGDPDTGISRPGTDQLAISTNGSERLRIDSSGNVGIGTTSPLARLHVEDTGGGDLFYALGANLDVFKISSDSSTINLDTRNATGGLAFQIQGTECARIDTSGRLLVNTSASVSQTVGGGTNTPQIQLAGTTQQSSSVSLVNYFSGGSPSNLILGSSTGGTVGTQGVVAINDILGRIAFTGSDGSNLIQAAEITAGIDGTPGANDMPGRLVFSVTADGASSPTEAMRIKNTRVINFSNAPVYADNAAAKTGGLVDGDVYRTSTGDLKIVYT